MQNKYEEKLDNLTIKVVEGFARGEVQFENIIKRQDVANGKLGTHDAILQAMQIKDAVQSHEVDGLTARNVVVDKYKFLTMDKIIGMAIGLLGTGIVVIISYATRCYLITCK